MIVNEEQGDAEEIVQMVDTSIEQGWRCRFRQITQTVWSARKPLVEKSANGAAVRR